MWWAYTRGEGLYTGEGLIFGGGGAFSRRFTVLYDNQFRHKRTDCSYT